MDTAAPLHLDKAALGQIVLVLQGGGALGAYQAGVYQALDEAGIEPDWVIGTSIGAINAGIIAGNAKADRLPQLRNFWQRMEQRPGAAWLGGLPFVGAAMSNAMTMMQGIGGFFAPNPAALLGGALASRGGGILFDRAAREDARRGHRSRRAQRGRDAVDRRCGERADRDNALFR